jgi:hypothetical protein
MTWIEQQKWTPWLQLAAVIALALAARLAYQNPTVHFDEFYHILAAQSVVDDGSLRIADGDGYTRGRLFTYMVAASYKIFGQSIASARLPSVLAGSLLVGLVFAWMRSVSGTIGAWAAAMLLAFSPHAIHLSQTSRFYMLEALCVWVASIALYECTVTRWPPRHLVAWAFAGLIAAALAIHLQVVSLIPLGAAIVWACLTAFTSNNPFSRNHRRWLLAAVLLLTAIALITLLTTGTLQFLLSEFRRTALWASPQADDAAYYHRFLLTWYQLLWVLAPFAVVAAATHGAPGVFCLCVFFVTLLAHSFAGFKAPRYFFHALPFFFCIWGFTLGQLLPRLHDQLMTLAARAFRPLPRRRLSSVAGWLVLIFLLLAVSHYVQAYHTTRSLLTNPRAANPFAGPDWAAAAHVLRPLTRECDMVVTSASPKALYYLGRHDFGLSATQLQNQPEFTRDYRVGRPLISTAQSLQQVMQQAHSGLIVIETDHWAKPYFVPRATTDFIEQNAQPAPLDSRWGLLAFTWGPASDQAPPTESRSEQ